MLKQASDTEAEMTESNFRVPGFESLMPLSSRVP